MKKIKMLTVLAMVIVLSMVLGACIPVGSSSSRNDQPALISVSGSGKVYMAPDIAYVYLGVHSEADTVSVALNQNNAQAQAVADALKEFGVEAKDIQTTAFNVFPIINTDENGNTTTRYAVDNTVYVTIRDLLKLGEMLDAVARSGANNINGITFDVENRTQAEADARRQAVEDARMKAEEAASAAGVKVGDVFSVSVYSYGNAQPMYDAKGGIGAGSVTPIAAGQMVITAEASVSYEIKQ